MKRGNGGYLGARQRPTLTSSSGMWSLVEQQQFKVGGIWPVALLPGAPTGVTASPASGSATVSFTAPAFVGFPTSLSYTATSSPGGLTGTGSSSPVTVSGLVPGTTYTFTVTATNATGTGPASAASNSIVIYTVPGAPTIGTATATGYTTATVSYTAPASNGGSTIISYTAVSSPGGITTTLGQSGSGTISITGLTAGANYTFTVYATNAVGNSASSAASNSITTTAARVPGAPTGVSASATGSTSASVSFSAPSDNGGTAITSYTAISNPDSVTGSSSGSPISVSGLSDGKSYTFSVYATNSIGNGPASSSSNSITTPLGYYLAYFNTQAELYVGDDLSFADNQDFTVECWAYRNTGNTHNFWSIGTETTRRVQLQSSLFEVFGGFISRGFTAPSINAWHHYAVVRSGSTITVYVDGSAVTTATYSGVLGNSGPMYIGTRSNGGVNRLNGYMSNVRVVRGTAVYTGNFSPPTGILGIVGDTTLLTCQNSYTVDNSNYRRGISNSNVAFQSFGGY